MGWWGLGCTGGGGGDAMGRRAVVLLGCPGHTDIGRDAVALAGGGVAVA